MPGLGAIPRFWQARSRHAGTYDERWQRLHASGVGAGYPADFDLRFFQAAHPHWVFNEPLTGNERIALRCFDDDAHCQREVLKGYGEGLVELPIEATKMVAEGWKNIVTEPVETGKALLWGAGELGGMALDGWRQIVSDPGQAFDAFVWAAKEGLAQANEILGGDSREGGKLVGEAVSMALPTGVAKAKAKPKPKPAPTSGAAILRKKPPPDGYKSYKTHGTAEDPLGSPEGRRLVNHLKEQGYSQRDAVEKAADLMKTGSDLPLANPVEIGDRLYKVVPEGSMPGAKSEYWATRDQIGALEGMSRDQIANRLGLPLESQQAERFDVVEIKAMRPSMTFDSKIAPTTQNGWSQTGGGIQSLVTDRGAFTPPVKTGIKLP